jgi:hypothetical protein
VADTCNPSYLGCRDQEDHGSWPAWKIVQETLSQKYPTQNRAGRVVQVVEHLLNMGEDMSSDSSTTKKEKVKLKPEFLKDAMPKPCFMCKLFSLS